MRHAKRLPRHRTAAGDVPTLRTENASSGHALQPPTKSHPRKTAAADTKAVRKADRLPALAPQQELPRQSQTTVAPQVRRGKTPQLKHDAHKEQAVPQPVGRQKTTPQGTTPRASEANASAKPKGGHVSMAQSLARKPSTKASNYLDVYDMPPSDEEIAPPARKPSRLGSVAKAKEKERKEQPQKPQNEASKKTAESDDSNASRKRKRRGSASSVAMKDAIVDRQSDASVPQRNRKLPRTEEPILRSHEPSKRSKMTYPQGKASCAVPTINKPKRTRQLTVPVFSQRPISKGQSSPAQLSSMLPNKSQTKPSPLLEAPDAEDETMYEIPLPLTTPVRSSKKPSSGSVTPRQKALFSSLLGDASRTPMPSIGALRLTDKKPSNSLGSLVRSKSDLTYSVQARKTRLIDTLKHTDASSEDEENDTSDTESEASSNRQSGHERTGKCKIEQPHEGRLLGDIYPEDMDIEPERAVEARASQVVSAFNSRAKFTYAKARSHLEEANPEDAFLISMGLDDDFGFDSQNKDSPSGDDNDPSSQVQAHHVLKRKGQQNRFNDDVRMYIDDLPITSGNTVRRSAMLELCSQMEDETFTNQLLDSTLATQFLESIISNGEIIFDFAAAVAIVFLLNTNSTSFVLDQIYRTGIITSLVKLTSNELEIRSIAKNRKTNLSKIAVGSVIAVREKLLASSIWSSLALEKVTPQIVALKALESIVVGLRRSGNVELLLDQSMVSTIIDTSPKISKNGTVRPEDVIILQIIVSILESVSISRQKQSLWPMKTLERLADMMSGVFGLEDASSTMLAVKLCMNLTNNKPKACLPFSGHAFIQSLAATIPRSFARLHSGLKQDERTAVLESLILSLGALINLAEFSDQARMNVDDGERLLSTLVKIFVEGSERAARVFIVPSLSQAFTDQTAGPIYGGVSIKRACRLSYCAPWQSLSQPLCQDQSQCRIARSALGHVDQ